jgi:Histidine phosphatase superfamily (branch 1)
MTSSSLRRTAFTIAFVLLALPSSILGAAGQTRASAPATLRIYLARHGQTDWNVEGRMQGGTDTPLNATGRQQAAALKDHLKDVRFDAVYSSTLGRSRETAEIVRGQVPLSSLAGLGERRFGKFEGLLSDAPDTGPEFQRRRWDPQDALDGGESWVAFTDRVRSAAPTRPSSRFCSVSRWTTRDRSRRPTTSCISSSWSRPALPGCGSSSPRPIFEICSGISCQGSRRKRGFLTTRRNFVAIIN